VRLFSSQRNISMPVRVIFPKNRRTSSHLREFRNQIGRITAKSSHFPWKVRTTTFMTWRTASHPATPRYINLVSISSSMRREDFVAKKCPRSTFLVLKVRQLQLWWDSRPKSREVKFGERKMSEESFHSTVYKTAKTFPRRSPSASGSRSG